MELTCSPWTGFTLEAIHQPTFVVRGGSDTCVTRGMAHHLAARIPGGARGAAAPPALPPSSRSGPLGGAAVWPWLIPVLTPHRPGPRPPAAGTRHPTALAAAAALRELLPTAARDEEVASGVARVEVKGRGHVTLVVGCMGPIFAAAAMLLPQ
jgi:hypothetical protein